MPLINSNNYELVIADERFYNPYWNQLTEIFISKYGKQEITEPLRVTEILKECFEFLVNEFDKLISENREATFYLYVNLIHENSVSLWWLQRDKKELDIDETILAASRRIMKLILEQCGKYEMRGANNFAVEFGNKREKYIEVLEEMLFVGEQCFKLSEYISQSKLFPNSISLNVINDEFDFFLDPIYQNTVEFLMRDLHNHYDDFIAIDSYSDFEKTVLDTFNINLQEVHSIFDLLEKTQDSFPIIKYELLIQKISEKSNSPKDVVEIFFDGLTISEENIQPTKECILKNQHNTRIIFRPIIKIKIDNNNYCIAGGKRWKEGLEVLMTNSFPFGEFPSEWSDFKGIKKYINNLEDNHSSFLVDEAHKQISDREYLVDKEITSLKGRKNNTNLNKLGIGDLDILFIKGNTIFVCECKHNRSRYDFNNWERDYSKFTSKYEGQLNRKVEWVSKNKDLIIEHFKNFYSNSEQNYSFEAVDNYSVLGIFIINGVTLYMYDSDYLVFTIFALKRFLDENTIHPTLKFESNNSNDLTLQVPYFKNLKKLYK